MAHVKRKRRGFCCCYPLFGEKENGFKSHAWQEIVSLVKEDELEKLIAWQAKAVETSVEYVKRLRREYQKS